MRHPPINPTVKNGKLQIGIIGTGGVAHWAHFPAWQSIKEAEIVAVADINAESAKAAAAKYNIPHIFTDFNELVKLDLDAVDICTPNRFHAPAAMAALMAGKHVICEKPLATTTAEVRMMGECADKNSLVLMTSQHMRYTANSQAIKRWAETGALGDIYHARVRAMRQAYMSASSSFHDSAASGGGPCVDIGVHALDNCLWIMGIPRPVRVSGTIKTNFAKGHVIPGRWGEWNRELVNVEDFSSGYIHFENGATMTLECAWLGHQEEKEDLSWQLFGSKSGVQWPSCKYQSTLNGVFLNGVISPAREVERAHTEAIKDFVRCVLAKAPSPVPWTETIRVIAILEGIYESARTGAEVKLSAF